MGKVIQLRIEDGRLYGECPFCYWDEFHLLMDVDGGISGAECCSCRKDFEFEGEGISFELDGRYDD